MTRHWQRSTTRSEDVGDGPRSRRPWPFRALAQAIVGVLVLGLSTALALTVSTPAQAVYAEAGGGLYKGSIDWFQWSDLPNQVIPSEGITKTNSRVIAGQTLTTTCVISNVVGGLMTYRPGAYGGDALDDLYNVGGTGNANKMIIGLANQADGGQSAFDVSCAATLNGESIPLQGLVFADAEASTASQGEFIEATPATPATWRVIDRFRSPQCTTSTQAIVNSTGTLRFAPNGTACIQRGMGTGPMAVGFMEGATEARMTTKGGGRSAVALGVVLQADFGDAPTSYGEAGALFEPSWSGGELSVGTTAVSGSDFELGVPAQPLTRLGATVDSDSGYLASPDALGDDIDGNSVSDEDAITNPGALAVTPGQTYTLSDVSCTGPGFVAGWIDWNRNGGFDAGERSGAVECVGSSVDLTWTVPADATTGASFLRLRIAADELQVASPVGITTSGEVEDYSVTVQLPELSIQKTSTATEQSRVGDTVTYTITAVNEGQTAFTNEFPAVIVDDLTAVLDDGSYNGDATATRPGQVSYAAPLLAWSGALGVGESVELDYTVELTAGGDGVVRNVAWVPLDPQNPKTPSCDVATGGTTDPETGEPCAAVAFELPRLVISKSADRIELPAVGETVNYTVEVSNPGPGDYTVANPATLVDDLSDVLDDATFDGTATATVGAATFTAPKLLWTGVLSAGEAATIGYAVTYTGAGDQSLVNVACIPEIQTAAGENPCVRVTVPGARLTQWKSVESSSTPAVAGSELSYTLHFGNDGSAAATVDAVDALAHVLDDADVTVEPVASAGLSAVRNGDSIAITGSVAPGTVSTVTYRVTIKPDGERGDDIASNFLLLNDPANPPVTPTTPGCTPQNQDRPNCTSTPVAAVTYEKSVSSSSNPVGAGTVLTYTVTVRSTGAAVTAVSRDDVLADVLDDATLSKAPVSDTVSVIVGPVADNRFHIGGELEPGAVATITYSVTVNDASNRGNNSANNFLVPRGATPSAECPDGATDCTVTPLPAITVTKSADPESGTLVAAGQTVKYTITITNTGAVAGAADYTDDLSGVLDDAILNGPPTASDSALTVTTGTTGSIRMVGTVEAGQTATVDYAVTVKQAADRGDSVLRNVVAITGDDPVCAAGSALCTEHPVIPTPASPTAATPGEFALTGGVPSGVLWLALMLPLGLGVLFVVSARRSRKNVTGGHLD